MRAAPILLDSSQVSSGSRIVIGFANIGTIVSESGNKGGVVGSEKLIKNGPHCSGVEKLIFLKKQNTTCVERVSNTNNTVVGCIAVDRKSAERPALACTKGKEKESTSGWKQLSREAKVETTANKFLTCTAHQI